MRNFGMPKNVIATAAVVAWLAGCSSSSPGEATGGTGGSTNDSGHSTTADAGACSTAMELVADPPICTRLVNTASPVPFTAGTGYPPVATAGTLVDGNYVSTKAEGFGSAGQYGRRITLAVLDGGTRIMWAGEVLDAAGQGVVSTFTADTTVSPGTQAYDLNFVTTCSSSATSPVPAVLSYSATPNEIVLISNQGGGTGAATTYTRVPCP